MKKLLPFLVSFGFLLAFSSQRSNAQVSYNMCSGGTMVTLTDTAGNFYDSGGPTGNYQNSELCTLLVAPSCGTSVTLTFTAIDLEINYDSIYVYNGSTVTAPLLAALSGSTLPAPITANSGQMLIRLSRMLP